MGNNPFLYSRGENLIRFCVHLWKDQSIACFVKFLLYIFIECLISLMTYISNMEEDLFSIFFFVATLFIIVINGTARMTFVDLTYSELLWLQWWAVVCPPVGDCGNHP